MQRTLYIPIPARDATPATKLFVKIVAEDEASLKAKPYVMMLSGGPGMNHSHYTQYACLQDVCNIIFYDPRGCGLSDKGDITTYTMNNNIQDAEAIREHLELENIGMIGKSYGGMCALGYAIRFPQRLTCLVLASSAPSHKFMETAQQNFAARQPSAQQIKSYQQFRTGGFASDDDVAAFQVSMGGMYSYRQRRGEVVPWMRSEYPVEREPFNQGFRTYLHEFDFEPQLSQVLCNTLVLVGEEDWATDKQHSQLMADRIPNSKLIIFPKADHAIELDVPNEYFQAMREFVRNMASAQTPMRRP